MSRAARAAIAAAQRARWAKVKAGKGAGAPKKRRKVSAAARARLAAHQKVDTKMDTILDSKRVKTNSEK